MKPSAPGLARKTVKNTTLGNYEVPKGVSTSSKEKIFTLY
jgi:hypothetical protein